MASITDVVKEGLKYPFNDGKKVLTLGAFFLVSSLISFFLNYKVYDSLVVVDDLAPFDSINAAISAIPPSNMALIVIGSIISCVLMLFVSGYLYNVIKYSIENKSELPDFKDIKGIFLNGIRSWIVEIAYSILPAILFLLGLMLAVNESVSGTVNAIGGIILLIALIFAIFMGLMEIMALCNVVAKDELSAAFRFKEVLALVKNFGWGRFFGIILFSFIAIMIISVFFEFIFGSIATVISMIVGSAAVLVLVKSILDSLLVNPYTSIVLSRIYGSVYREANNE